MKKTLCILYRIICDASIVFSAMVLFFALFIFRTDTSYLNHETIVSFLLFSLVFGLSSILFQIQALPKLALTFLHFIVNLVSFIFNILRTAERSSSQVFVGAFVFVGVYLAASLLIWLITIPLRKKESIIENEEAL